MYFRSYICLTEHILDLRILYLYYRTYTCISDLIHVLQSIYLSYGTYTCVTELILVLRILFLCEGTCRYDKSEQIRIISPIRSDQTYTICYAYNRLMLIRISRRSYRTYSYSEIPAGITDQNDTHSFILIHHSGYFHITKGIPRPVIINE